MVCGLCGVVRCVLVDNGRIEETIVVLTTPLLNLDFERAIVTNDFGFCRLFSNFRRPFSVFNFFY